MNSQIIFKVTTILLLLTSISIAKKPKTQFFKTKSIRQNLAETRKNIVKLDRQLKSSRKSFTKKPTKQKSRVRRSRITRPRRSFLPPRGTFKPKFRIRNIRRR